MAKETQIGQLVIDLKTKLEGVEKGFETVKKRLQEIEQENKQLKNSNSELDASFIATTVSMVASLKKVISIIKECKEEYKSHTQAISSLSDVADHTGNSLNDMSQLMNKYSKYMTQGDLASTIKNFSLMNMTMEQQDQIIGSLINSAIKNRNANYDVSTAVKVASDGYKQGLSTLSDSAGVTENLSVMQDKYAKSIGKTASQLTELEQNQAYVNRTMEAAAPFAGAMEEYLDTLAGKEGEYAQAMRETRVAYAEALEPTLIKMAELKTNLTKLLGNLINSNNTAVTGITAFGVALIASIVIIVAAKKAKDAYTKSVLKATIAEKGFAAVLKANPLATTLSVISIGIGIYTAYKTKTEELAEAQANLNEISERYNKIKDGNYKYTNENITQAEKDKQAIEEQIKLMKRKIELKEKINNIGTGDDYYKYANGNGYSSAYDNSELAKYQKELDSIDKQLKELENTGKSYGKSLDELNEKLGEYSTFLEEGNGIQQMSKVFDIEKIKTQQKEAAQLKINANQLQSYLNTIKTADKTSTEYKNAVDAVAKAYPEVSSAGGILTDVLQGIVDAQQIQADEAWNASKTNIQTYIDWTNAAINNENIQKQIAENMGIAWDESFGNKLRTILGLLELIGGYTPEQVPNITPVSTPKKSSGGGYSNKRLDNYKKEIEHKKAMDQISINQEISMYEYALKKYAKTTDEKRELREKIYELNKELAKKEKEILDQQAEDYENYIQEQKNLRGSAYDTTQQTSDYNKIIQMHRNYLNQIMKDERLSLDERKELYREELDIIRDYEQQKRDLRVESIDNTVSHLTSAITKQLEEMQEKDKEMIDNNLKLVENWKNARIEAINAEYDARIEAIEKELQALDKAEQQKSRDEEDTEYERKRNRLQDLIDFEHDAVTKANYQKELDKLIAEYQKTLDQRALEDKKEALNAQKELLQEEQDNKLQSVEDEVEKQKEIYNKQLEDLENYYSEQIDMAQKTAENMLLNVEQNQDKILNLLQSYGNAYEITGQSLGEKLAQGINEGIASRIENIVARIQNSLDAGIEAQIAKMASSVYRYEAGANKPQTTSISTTQNIYIEQNPEMPSETYRKLRNINEQLAADLAGM